MRNAKSLLEVVNTFPLSAKEALENVYHGKVYAVGRSNGHIDHFFKTRRGAEGYINKKSYVTYYDEYSREMVNCGSGLIIEEINANDILDYKTNKKIWYNVLKEYNGRNFMYDNILHWVNRFGVSTEIVEYVTTTVEELKQYKGLTVIDEYEDQEETFEQVEETNEIKQVETVEVAETESVQTMPNNTEVTYTLNQQMNGIEITFSEKPSVEVIEQLKLNGFRWSYKQSLWYAKQSPERLQFAEQLTGSNQTESEPTEQVFTYPDIDIEDIHTYTVSEQLQRAEHDASWIFRKGERNQTQEIQEHFRHYNNQVQSVLITTDNERIRYYLKRDLQRYKKKYFDNFLSRLRHKANNPSWAVTGRGNMNVSKYNKALSREDKLMQESIELTNQINSAIERAKRDIRQEQNANIREQMANTDLVEFTTESKEITLHGLTEKVRTYNFQDYMICRTWGCFRVFYKGKEIYSMKTTDKLDDAKRYVSLLVNQNQAV